MWEPCNCNTPLNSLSVSGMELVMDELVEDIVLTDPVPTGIGGRIPGPTPGPGM